MLFKEISMINFSIGMKTHCKNNNFFKNISCLIPKITQCAPSEDLFLWNLFVKI